MPDPSDSLRRFAAPPMLSVVIPCFNEDPVVARTIDRLVAVVSGLDWIRCELIFIDDGSVDDTLAVLSDRQAADERIRVIALSRNFGHQVAVTAGLEHASGDAVVVIDADLQDPPEVIIEMLEQWRDGADVVYGVRSDRAGESAFKLWTARGFYRLINRLSDVPIPLDTGDFRLMDRRVVNALTSMPERDRFLRGMVAWVGYRQQPLRYQRDPRLAGESKYPLRKMVRFAVDGVLSFSLTPLRLATWLGFTAAGFALALIVYTMLVRLFTQSWVAGWAMLMIAVLFVGGVQLVSLGIIGEYVGRVYGEVKRRPLYFVRKRIGFDTRDAAAPASGGAHGQRPGPTA